MNRVVCEWWAYDERGWSTHRVAASSRQACYETASRSIGGGEPYAFGVVESADDSPARDNPGRIVSRLMRHEGDELQAWRVRDDGPEPFYRAGGMGRFYRRTDDASIQ